MATLYSVVVRQPFVRSEVTGESLGVWTNEKQNGVTVRVNHLPKEDTLRFHNAVIEDAFVVDTLF